MKYWLRHSAAAVLLFAACAGGSCGTALALPPAPPSAAVGQAQSIHAVTVSDGAVTAGLVAEPADPATRFVVIDPPAHGTVSLDGATFTYTPAPGYTGSDAFQYAVAGAAASTPATVDVQVLSTAVAPPSLATACTDLGPAFTPVCTAIGDITTPLVQSCSAVAPANACSLLGGNKYGLVSACFDVATGQLVLACKGLGTAMQLAASQCRVVDMPIDSCARYSGTAIGDPTIRTYLSGPVHKALQQQYRLGLNSPLRQALVPATHNSFNYTNANVPPTVSGMDPDQLYSMTQQLEMDIRGLELDVHWFPHLGSPGGYAPILCHGFTDHLGCTFERTFASGLQHIRSWLDAHPDAVIILDVEQHLNDGVDDVGRSFPAAAAAIESTLGRDSARDIVFRPGQMHPGATCATQDIPLDVSLARIHATGKQVLMYSSGCGYDPNGWDSIIFNERNRIQDEASAFGGSQYPDCHFSREQYQTSWTRFYDSSTLIDALSGAGPAQPMPPAQIQAMVRCGVNMPSINFVDPDTAQLEAFVWSWAYGQPLSAPAQQCAVHSGAGRFQAESCTQLLHYVCAAGDGWHLTTRGVFSSGPPACAAEFPGSVFAVPRNGYHNELLKTAKSHAGVDRAWLGYASTGDGQNWAPTGAAQPL